MAIVPTIKQYSANQLNLAFFTKEIIQVQAKMPVKKAAIKPIPKGIRLADE